MMTHIPTPQRTDHQKVQGEFYPLQKQELVALRKARLINNAAYVHLALRYENPFCDRPIKITPKEFSLRWSMPESSVYEALGRLKKLEIINIKTSYILIQWADEQSSVVSHQSSNQSPVASHQSPVRTANSSQLCNEQSSVMNENTALVTERSFPQGVTDDCLTEKDVSENPESILGSQNDLHDSRIDSESSENRGSEPSPAKDSDSLQTLQTAQTSHTQLSQHFSP